MHARNPFTLLVRQSGECVSRYFCSYNVCDARFSRLEQKELFFISSSSLIILDQQERCLPLIVLKGKVPHVCVCLCVYVCIYIYIYIHTHIYTSKLHAFTHGIQNELHVICKPVVFTLCSVVYDCSKWNLWLKTYMLFSVFIC
jgi:hypothetical protein